MQIPPEMIKAIAVCGVFGIACLGAIVLGLLDHQRKMARILRSDKQATDGLNERVDALQGQIRELHALVASKSEAHPQPDELTQRIR